MSDATTATMDGVLETAVQSGIITLAQREALRALAAERARGDACAAPIRASAAPVTRGGETSANGERPRALNAVTVAYGLGALLVAFSAGWFLVDRWARLGPWGVLGVVLGYAVVLAVGARWLLQHRFGLAAQLCVALAVGMTPLVAWALLTLIGRWPDPAGNDPLLHDRAWMAWQWLVVDLSTLLAALVVWRRLPMPLLAWPAAVALWASALHLSRVVRTDEGPRTYDEFLFLAIGLLVLAVADGVERWQRRHPTRALGPESSLRAWLEGDFAGPFWVGGLLASSVAYLAIWLRTDGPWRHLLPVIALALVVLSLYLRRRIVLLFGVAGVVGYLGYLANDVFRDYVSFPVLLAALGILVILLTVWTQLRFPALVERLDAGRASAERPLPWSAPMAALPALVAFALSIIGLADAAEEREQLAFRQRWYILRLHSGSLARDVPRPGAGGAPAGVPPGRASAPTTAPRPPAAASHQHD